MLQSYLSACSGCSISCVTSSWIFSTFCPNTPFSWNLPLVNLLVFVVVQRPAVLTDYLSATPLTQTKLDSREALSPLPVLLRSDLAHIAFYSRSHHYVSAAIKQQINLTPLTERANAQRQEDCLPRLWISSEKVWISCRCHQALGFPYHLQVSQFDVGIKTN